MVQKRRHRIAILRMEGDPDAGGGAQFDALDADRRRQRGQYPIGHLQAFRSSRDRLQYDDELIAAQSRDRVDPAHDVAQPLRNFLEQFVARTMAQGVIDGLESIQIQKHQSERLAASVGKRYRLADPVFEQGAIWQSGEGVMGGEVAQLRVRGFKSLGAIRDDFFERLDLAANDPFVLPLAGQRIGALEHLDRLEGLLDNQQFVRVPEAGDEFRPVVASMRRADHDLHVRVDPPELLDGLEAVPPRRHLHIDDRHCIRAGHAQRFAHALHTFLPLQGRVNLEVGASRCQGGRPEKRQLIGLENRGPVEHRTEYLPEVLVNGRIVVDDEHSPVDDRDGLSHDRPAEVSTVDRE